MKWNQVHDPAATLQLLTGDDWGPWLAETLDGAQSSILLSLYMLSHHWRVPSRFKLDLLDTLARCARRGLQCRGILASSETITSRHPFNEGAARTLIDAGWSIRGMRQRLLHEKTLLIDRRMVIIGSHNISKASLATNHDTSIAIESQPLADQAWRIFWERWRVASPWGT
ncbi:MAG: phospholipase D-like domain-containing protein [Candidatus Contendobacter sp.]|nr:phospholipase D-like domain-containing protein [Candidatus Contendobacter sp.]